jgi:hypothetical protein
MLLRVVAMQKTPQKQRQEGLCPVHVKINTGVGQTVAVGA